MLLQRFFLYRNIYDNNHQQSFFRKKRVNIPVIAIRYLYQILENGKINRSRTNFPELGRNVLVSNTFSTFSPLRLEASVKGHCHSKACFFPSDVSTSRSFSSSAFRSNKKKKKSASEIIEIIINKHNKMKSGWLIERGQIFSEDCRRIKKCIFWRKKISGLYLAFRQDTSERRESLWPWVCVREISWGHEECPRRWCCTRARNLRPTQTTAFSIVNLIVFFKIIIIIKKRKISGRDDLFRNVSKTPNDLVSQWWLFAKMKLL